MGAVPGSEEGRGRDYPDEGALDFGPTERLEGTLGLSE